VTLLGFVGDILIDRAEPESVFQAVSDVLAAPDVLFGNCEAPYTTSPHLAPTSGIPLTPHPSNTKAFDHFDVLSLANNHIVDAGHAAMLETADHLRAVGAIPIGIGRDIAEARRPAKVQCGGLRLAYLAYASVFPFGYEARSGWPGLAPVRAMNHHIERLPNYWVPGVLGSVVSVPHQDDHDALAADLHLASGECDLVVASFHWGDFQEPFTLTDHERRTARFAIDHGADIVVGHHHHILRGMEWYAGKPIFYGLGHFVFDLRNPTWPDWYVAAQTILGEADRYELYDRPGWPLLPMHPDARMTMLAWVDLDETGGPIAAGFLPCALTPEGEVRPHDARSEPGQRVLDYVSRCCEPQQLPVDLAVTEEYSINGLATVRFNPRTPNEQTVIQR
jgi:poly-gamma-glutamate capsule biosynthesis protein CapA/YwtB (metallophosphatase superfamily)